MKMDPETQAVKNEGNAKEPEGMCPSEVSEPMKEEAGKKMKADSKSKGWFCTWPRCPAPPQDCLNDLQDKLVERKLEIQEYVISQEDHQDGAKHLHGFLKLNRRIRFNPRLFDFIYEGTDYHGHYESAKSWKAVEKYCKKYGNFISNIDIDAAKQGHSKKIGIKELETDALELLEKGTITGMQLNNFIKNQNVYRLLKQKRMAQKGIKLDLQKKRHFWY
nr:MAG: rep protein [Cressdnaviricota sp.]